MINWILDFLWDTKWIIFVLLLLNELKRVWKTYNIIQVLLQNIEESHSNISVILSQKLEIINQFATIVKQYDVHERDIQLQITNDYTQSAKEAADALSYIRGVAMAFPALKADSNYNIFLNNISKNEQALTKRREAYNSYVKEYNSYITQLPICILAKCMGYETHKYFNN